MKVKAICTKIAYQKDDFRILRWAVKNKIDGLYTVNNTFGTLGNDTWADVGREYELELELDSVHPQYGGSYIIKSVPSMLEQDIENLTYEEKFNILRQCTSSDRLAENILKAYPDFIIKILNEGKESIDIKRIHGVGEAYLNAYSRILNDKYKYFNIFNKFSDWEIDMKDARLISSRYGTEEGILKAFNDNPYDVLITTCDKSFFNVDKIILKNEPKWRATDTRCSYLMLDVLNKNEQESGSTRLNGNDLYFYIKNELNYPELLPLIVPTAQKSELIHYDEPTKDLAKMSTYSGECRIAQFIMSKLANNHVLDIDCESYRVCDGMTLSFEQFGALPMFCNNNFMLLLGYAGTGKTSILNTILTLCDDNGLTYALFSPTGSASLRMTEATNRSSSTIHRPFYREQTFDTDVIVVDEFSMVDVEVCNMLISMIDNPNAKVIFVGDAAQLTSVGAGNVFFDIINSGVVPVALLTKPFRYDSNGGIFVATNVRQGRDFFDDHMVKKVGEGRYQVCDNYEFIEKETEEIFNTVMDLYQKLLNKGVKSKDILCLSPYNVGDVGTYAINNAVQSVVNPPKANQAALTRKIGQTTIYFRTGDKIINKKNDYKVLPLESYQMIEESDGLLSVDDVPRTTVFNGQIGYIRDLNDKYCTVQFGEELVVFDKSKMAHDALLGYCISVHASQGSEADYVINVVSELHSRMLNRNLLYVAVTRAKKKHFDVGSKKAFRDAILIDGNKLRDTFLQELIKEEMKRWKEFESLSDEEINEIAEEEYNRCMEESEKLEKGA